MIKPYYSPIFLGSYKFNTAPGESFSAVMREKGQSRITTAFKVFYK